MGYLLGAGLAIVLSNFISAELIMIIFGGIFIFGCLLEKT